MRQMPGDVQKQVKIAMMESSDLWPSRKLAHDGLESSRCKFFRRMIRSRERAVLRERTLQEVREGSCGEV